VVSGESVGSLRLLCDKWPPGFEGRHGSDLFFGLSCCVAVPEIRSSVSVIQPP